MSCAWRVGATPLTRNSVLVTTITEMAKVALFDWNAKIRSFRSHSQPGYSDFYLTMVAMRPATQIDTKIAAYGLYSGALIMDHEQDYRECVCIMRWERQKVATLSFFRTSQLSTRGHKNQIRSSDPPLQLLPNLDDSAGNMSGKGFEVNNSTTNLENGALTADFDFKPDARSLAFGGIFLTIMSTLRQLAAQPKDAILDSPFNIGPIRPHYDVSVQFGGPSGPGPGHYHLELIIKTLAALPSFLVKSDRFAELFIAILVDDVRVGRGELRKADAMSNGILGEGLLAPNTNISTS